MEGFLFSNTLVLFLLAPPKADIILRHSDQTWIQKANDLYQLPVAMRVRKQILPLSCQGQTNELGTETDQMKSSILGLCNQLQ